MILVTQPLLSLVQGCSAVISPRLLRTGRAPPSALSLEVRQQSRSRLLIGQTLGHPDLWLAAVTSLWPLIVQDWVSLSTRLLAAQLRPPRSLLTASSLHSPHWFSFLLYRTHRLVSKKSSHRHQPWPRGRSTSITSSRGSSKVRTYQ